MANINRDLILSGPFLEAALKHSADVEDLLELCGRIKVQRAAVAIVETYLEAFPANESRGEVKALAALYAQKVLDCPHDYANKQGPYYAALFEKFAGIVHPVGTREKEITK